MICYEICLLCVYQSNSEYVASQYTVCGLGLLRFDILVLMYGAKV